MSPYVCRTATPVDAGLQGQLLHGPIWGPIAEEAPAALELAGLGRNLGGQGRISKPGG